MSVSRVVSSSDSSGTVTAGTDDSGRPAAGDPAGRPVDGEHGATASDSIPTGFFFENLSDDFRRTVVRAALQGRKKAQPSQRDRLNAQLKPLPVAGFRDASKARPSQLREPVLDAIRHGDDRLAAAVLALWAETEEPLRKAALQVLADANIAVVEPNFPNLRLVDSWPLDDWRARRDALVESHPDMDAEAAGLMLAVCAGRVPLQPLDPSLLLLTPRFRRWSEELVALPCDAAEWEEVPSFAATILGLGAAKLEELDVAAAEARDGALRRVGEQYADELEYLGIDLGPWSAWDGPDPADTLALTEELATALNRYRVIRPQAASRVEEAARAEQRARHEAGILELAARWKTLPRLSDEDLDDPGLEEASDPERLADQLAELRREHDRREADIARLEDAAEAAATERDRLAADNDVLRLAKEQLDGEIGDLKGDLAQARSTEEHWRLAYVAARKAESSDEDADAGIATVRRAIEVAERAFPEALAFSLNGKSDPDTPFGRPAEVFDALAWLATSYRRQPASSIGESCPGWFYKPAQSESTVGMFREWYRTLFEGRAYDITTHIGKGNSFDPRSTIRIAFAQDEESDRVVIGYIGRHQRNRQS